MRQIGTHFYFTFGTSEGQPFKGGWVTVIVDNVFLNQRRKAIQAFRAYFPDKEEGIVNCADIYTMEQMHKTKMLKEGNFGKKEHMRIWLMSWRGEEE